MTRREARSRHVLGAVIVALIIALPFIMEWMTR